MAYRLGVIPAAGKAERFGGVMKELLPARDGVSFLRHAADRLPVDKVLIVTTPEKIGAHAREVPEALFTIQRTKADIWGAMLESTYIPANYYYFTMPDTYMPEDAFYNAPDCDFALGVFETNTPERFGVLCGDIVVNKQPCAVPAVAWGALVWSARVVKFWYQIKPETYTHAINLAINKFGLETWDIGQYHDNASMRDYMEFLA